MSNNVVTVVQARVGSSRFPGKALRPINGRPMFLHALDRAAAMGFETWLATSDQERDQMLAEIAAGAGYPVYRGSERDVLQRMLAAAAVARADVVVRVTGDCPCFAPDIGARVVDLFLRVQTVGPHDAIFTNDTSRSGWADGLDVEVFPFRLLRQAHETLCRFDEHDWTEARIEARDSDWFDREHVTPWIRRHYEHRVLLADEADDFRRVKLSVDTPEDYERVRDILGRVPSSDQSWSALRAAVLAWEAEREDVCVRK